MWPIRHFPPQKPLLLRWRNENPPCRPDALCFAFAALHVAGLGRRPAERVLGKAFGDDERTCAVIRMLDREISARPDDERLRNLRIAAYGALNAPSQGRCGFSGRPAPGFPGFSTAKMPVRGSYGLIAGGKRVVELCRQQGKDLADINAHQVAEIERKRQAEIEPERVRKREFSCKSRGYDGPSFGR